MGLRLRRVLLHAAIVAATWFAVAAEAADAAPHRFAQPSAAQGSPAPVGSLAQVTFSLALVLAAVFGAAWLLRRVRAFGGTAQDGAIAVVAERAVGPRERVVLLQVGDECVLVGVAQGSVRALHTFRADRVRDATEVRS